MKPKFIALIKAGINTLFGVGLVGKGEKVIDRNLDLEKDLEAHEN